MFTIRTVVQPQSAEELCQLAKTPANCVLGGLMWLKMGERRIQKAIDLSQLALDQITYPEEDFCEVGAMVNLHQFESDPTLLSWTDGANYDAMHGIVGVQFRNGATIGGSLGLRPGFSDVCTLLLALDAKVLLADGQSMEMETFLSRPQISKYRPTILKVQIPRPSGRVSYVNERAEAGDLPILNVAICQKKESKSVIYRIAVGARPGIAQLVMLTEEESIQLQTCSNAQRQHFWKQLANRWSFSSNRFASATYRKHLLTVLLERAWQKQSSERTHQGGSACCKSN